MPYVAVDDDGQGFTFEYQPIRGADAWINVRGNVGQVSASVVRLLTGEILGWEDEPVLVTRQPTDVLGQCPLFTGTFREGYLATPPVVPLGDASHLLKQGRGFYVKSSGEYLWGFRDSGALAWVTAKEEAGVFTDSDLCFEPLRAALAVFRDYTLELAE